MSTKSVLVLLTIFLLSTQISAEFGGSWSEIYNSVSTFIYGLDFTSPSQGWLCGFNLLHPFGAQILQTSDSGNTIVPGNFNNGMEAIEFMAIDFDSNYGVAAGSGVALLPGIATTTDGQNWSTPEAQVILEATFTDVNTLPSQSAIVVGSWKTVRGSYSGYMESTNGGKFKGNAWPASVSARYGSFLNTTFGWVSGGTHSGFVPAPKSDGTIAISHDLAIDLYNKKLVPLAVASNDYEGVIVKTTNGGRKFTVQFNSTLEGLNAYFNGIQFVDENNGWAVAVEYNQNKSATYSHILNTKDGGNTWTTQLSEEHLRLFKIRMFDSKNGWAVGWKVPDLTLFSGEFYRTTDGGAKWTRTHIRDIIAFDIAPVTADTAYAVGFGFDFATNLYYFS